MSSCSYCVGAWALLTRCRSFHLVLSIDNLQLRQSMWGGVGSGSTRSRACDTFDIPYNSPYRSLEAQPLRIDSAPAPALVFSMEPSPLTQVSRPELFQPKIISLYETLFKVRMRPFRRQSRTHSI